MHFDITIIGGGHAGVEAAWISSQFNLNVAIITLPELMLASTPCNPAIGGVGKGQVVREIDALGGLMGKITDESAIQFRILNESKGYAVQSTRVQVDKDLYAKNAESFIAEKQNIKVIRAKVESVDSVDGKFLIKTDLTELTSLKVIVTTGTFLNGKLHSGEEQLDGGRVGCRNSKGLKDLFSLIRVNPTRFKTGTPARLDISTVDFSVMEPQFSEDHAKNFHYGNHPLKRKVEQIACHLTRTNEDTLSIIRANKERSPIFNGQITGVGPRYCPSIEDKAFRYLDRNSHHVFVEPEGLTAGTVYPNGISTSLPKEVQLEFIRTIPGLENAIIKVFGYAVEYDVVDTSKLDRTLQYSEIKGLYFAGQVNGTSGYEEAAAQGVVAGANAALSLLGQKPLIIDRNDSYIGVMIEDLVSNLRDEPYRLFTARSENRLYVREDNTINRMFEYRAILGLNTEVDEYHNAFISEYNILMNLCKSTQYKTVPKTIEYFTLMNYGPLLSNIFLNDLLKRSKLDPVNTLVKELDNFGAKFSEDVISAVSISIKYEGYIARANQETERLVRLSRKTLEWNKLIVCHNISNECRQRIESIKPETFGQLRLIDGIRPATLAFVAGNLL